VETIEPHVLDALPRFKYHLTWFLTYRPDLTRLVSHWHLAVASERPLLALVRGHHMKQLLKRMLDPAEFLSDYGILSLSKYHADHPYVLNVDGTAHTVRYEPAESRTELFSGNSNWRDNLLFHEFFHGDTGKGLGASHQTGWTGLVASLIQQQGVYSMEDRAAISKTRHLQTAPLSYDLPERR